MPRSIQELNVRVWVCAGRAAVHVILNLREREGGMQGKMMEGEGWGNIRTLNSRILLQGKGLGGFLVKICGLVSFSARGCFQPLGIHINLKEGLPHVPY